MERDSDSETASSIITGECVLQGIAVAALRIRAAADSARVFVTKVVEVIVEGRQPPDLTVIALTRRTNLPLLWSAQEQALGLR
jgi:hypothetical protein